jgi:Mg2+/citrate symporter
MAFLKITQNCHIFVSFPIVKECTSARGCIVLAVGCWLLAVQIIHENSPFVKGVFTLFKNILYQFYFIRQIFFDKSSKKFKI